MNLLKEFSLNDKCSYIDNKEQTTHYKVIENCSTQNCQDLIERGYRRFGKMYFRPICADCQECQSIKVDVENFEFSKSTSSFSNVRKFSKMTFLRNILSLSTLSIFLISTDSTNF